MRVLDHEPHAWFLLEEDGALYLDAFCSHSFLDYSVTIALDPEERAAYVAEGRSFLDALATRIHESAPAAPGSRSPYRARDLIGAHDFVAARATQAILAWRAKQA